MELETRCSIHDCDRRPTRGVPLPNYCDKHALKLGTVPYRCEKCFRTAVYGPPESDIPRLCSYHNIWGGSWSNLNAPSCSICKKHNAQFVDKRDKERVGKFCKTCGPREWTQRISSFDCSRCGKVMQRNNLISRGTKLICKACNTGYDSVENGRPVKRQRTLPMSYTCQIATYLQRVLRNSEKWTFFKSNTTLRKIKSDNTCKNLPIHILWTFETYSVLIVVEVDHSWDDKSFCDNVHHIQTMLDTELIVIRFDPLAGNHRSKTILDIDESKLRTLVFFLKTHCKSALNHLITVYYLYIPYDHECIARKYENELREVFNTKHPFIFKPTSDFDQGFLSI
jgi:hypothetical protein